MEKYEYQNVGSSLYNFIWEDFCDWYIELSKNDMSITNKCVLLKVLTAILKMLHPFMPYVTEEIYQMLPIKDQESIVISSYPVYEEEYVFDKDKDIVDKVLDDIVSIRNMKQTKGITKDAFVKIKVNDKSLLGIFKSQLKIKDENIVDLDKDGMLNSSFASKNIDIVYYYEGQKEDGSKVIDEIRKLEESIKRREALLDNPNYVNKAPSHIVDLDRQKLIEEKEKLEILRQR